MLTLSHIKCYHQFPVNCRSTFETQNNKAFKGKKCISDLELGQKSSSQERKNINKLISIKI